MMNRKGFTLLEILVAIIIFTIGLTSLLPLFMAGATSQKRSADQTMVSIIAKLAVAEIQENLTTITPRDIKDAKVTDYTNYSYDAAFQPLNREATAFTVDITIKWLEKGRTRSEQFSTVLIRKLKHQNP